MRVAAAHRRRDTVDKHLERVRTKNAASLDRILCAGGMGRKNIVDTVPLVRASAFEITWAMMIRIWKFGREGLTYQRLKEERTPVAT